MEILNLEDTVVLMGTLLSKGVVAIASLLKR